MDKSVLYQWHERCTTKLVVRSVTKYRQTILIIDDEEELCLVLSYALRKKGYQVEYSLNLEEGSEKLNKLNPDVVLLDINLPDGSGLHMIPEIKQRNSSFLVISAYEDKKRQALAAGAADFVKKPFDLETITMSIKDIIENSRT
jgi:DNA-binding response OmpR family regulator